MASSLRSPNSQAAPGGGVTLPPSQEKIQQKFDLSIALTLSTWPALTLSVQNSWGGPQSAEKRDWFAGAISDLFSSTPSPETTIDVEYLEEFLLNIVNDEFEVNVEDDSGAEIAAKILGLRKMCFRGEFEIVDEMYERWRARQAKGEEKVHFQHVGREDDEEDESDSEEVEEDEDVEMGEAPELAKAPKEKVVPKVDEEGFIEVVGRKRR
ncbi:MAG: hypothetical protein Q9166_005620 [cf. Caloplaca sp. 2 TL-2023]